MRTKKVWCVKDRNGWWCAAKDGEKPVEGVTSAETKCGMFVILPCGIDKRQPSCDGCSSHN